MDLVGATIILIQCKEAAAVDLFVGDSVKRKTDSKKRPTQQLAKKRPLVYGLSHCKNVMSIFSTYFRRSIFNDKTRPAHINKKAV